LVTIKLDFVFVVDRTVWSYNTNRQRP